MSRGFWVALALIGFAFAGYETALNLFLRRTHPVESCIRVDTTQYIQARAEQ